MNEIVTENPQLTANDLVTAKTMAETLHQHYPGHLWAVTCDGATGMASVRNLALSGMWGFQLRLPATYTASDFKRRVVRAGGELLERFRVSRGALRPDEMASLRTDFSGNHKADL